jgi:LPS O-antigen subunit length determinant protein (WzzB/FepE family)
LSSTPYSKHESEDEINLLDLLGFLVRNKKFIFSTASIFVVLSMLYAFSMVVTYRVTIDFLPPDKALTFFFPELIQEVLPNISRDKKGGIVVKKNDYMLYKFIAELQSFANQEKVFNAGKFHERFIVNNPKDNMKGIVQEINRSIHVTQQEKDSKEVKLSPQVASFEMKGVKPEVSSDFLNALADFAKSKAEFDIKELIQIGVKTLTAKTSARLSYLLSIEKLDNEGQIKILTENLTIAKNLGILENNFVNLQQTRQYTTDNWLNVSGSYNGFPIWYLYGQRAIEQQLDLLKHRNISANRISKYSEYSEYLKLNAKIALLSNIDLSKVNLVPVIISKTSIPPADPINTKKINIVAVGITLGLFIGIFMTIIRFVMIQPKKRL